MGIIRRFVRFMTQPRLGNVAVPTSLPGEDDLAWVAKTYRGVRVMDGEWLRGTLRNRERYIAQSAATTFGAPAPLPPESHT